MGIKGRRRKNVKTEGKTNINKITTPEMEFAIAKNFNYRQNLIVPNVSWGFDGMHECDLFIVRRSGYAIEVEIKISKSDLLADFKKPHKHEDKKKRIVQFYYALPDYLLPLCENLIPENAGIISVMKLESRGKTHYNVYIKREAKRIQGARKLTKDEQYKIARLGTLRVWNLKEKYQIKK